MKKNIKYLYALVTLIFMLLTIYEIIMYLKTNSSYIGLFYLFFNFFIMFMLFTISINYEFANKNIRISKNIISILIGIFSSFVLPFVLTSIFNYTDESYLFSNSVFIISKIIKPIIYLLLGVLSVVEIKCVK